jgi:hypothetical protein
MTAVSDRPRSGNRRVRKKGRGEVAMIPAYEEHSHMTRIGAHMALFFVLAMLP